MMTPESIILRLHYTADRQNDFCRLSGDYNPIHDDPVAARRTLVGAQVVHGMHHVLAGMEALLKYLAQENHAAQGITGFTAQFLKPVVVGDTLDFHLASLAPKEARIVARIEGEIMCQLAFQMGEAAPEVSESLAPLPRQKAHELAFGELAESSGSLPLGLDGPLAQKLFSLVVATMGTVGLAEVLALSRLVGMHCPGLHSLFSQATARWDGTGGPNLLTYGVEQTDERFNRIVIGVKGPRLQGRLTAFFRPPPEPQSRMTQVANHVDAGEFAGSVSLVVGGSRGIGEITAKIIAAGGGLPIVTYHQGAADAELLAKEIRDWGGRCEVLQFDVRQGESTLKHLLSGKNPPTTLYYFATPKIGLRRGFFSQEMLARYSDYYVAAFGRILEGAMQLGMKLRVFYPSSIYVSEKPREMAEYSIAKRAGEELCAFYNQYAKGIEIIVERLPRIKTDQTSALLAIPAEESLDVMLPIIRKIEVGGEMKTS